MMKNRRFERTERGQSFLELAISMTLLFILLSGVIDLGRAFFTYISLRDAVQEGAAYASIEPHDCQEIRRRVREQSTQPINLETDPGITITVEVDGVTCTDTTPTSTAHFCPGDPIRVAISYDDFETMMPFMGGRHFPLRAEVDGSVLMDSDPDPDQNPTTPSSCYASP